MGYILLVLMAIPTSVALLTKTCFFFAERDQKNNWKHLYLCFFFSMTFRDCALAPIFSVDPSFSKADMGSLAYSLVSVVKP